MKLMDEVAGIVAARHCKTNIVTASVDAINFHEKIKKGARGGGGHFALLQCHCLWLCTQGTPAENLSPCLGHRAHGTPCSLPLSRNVGQLLTGPLSAWQAASSPSRGA